MHRLALVVVVALAACGSKAKPPEAPHRQTATLKALENGDRACYVVLETDAGEQSIEGSFELCAGGSSDATGLIGKRVLYKTERANVQAASCEGNPDCQDSDLVDLVISVELAP